jgi:hypothetical protein
MMGSKLRKFKRKNITRRRKMIRKMNLDIDYDVPDTHRVMEDGAIATNIELTKILILNGFTGSRGWAESDRTH